MHKLANLSTCLNSETADLQILHSIRINRCALHSVVGNVLSSSRVESQRERRLGSGARRLGATEQLCHGEFQIYRPV